MTTNHTISRHSRERERNVLFNDALNTFYLWLYGVRHMVKDHSDSEKGNPVPPHRLLLSINSKGSFICTIPQTGSILHDGPIELFLIPASAPQLVQKKAVLNVILSMG